MLDLAQVALWTLPDLIVVIGVFVVLGVDYGYLRKQNQATRWHYCGLLGSRILVIAAAVAVAQIFLELPDHLPDLDPTLAAFMPEFANTARVDLGNGQLIFTTQTLALKIVFYLMGAVVLGCVGRRPPSDHISEPIALILTSVLGLGLLATTTHLIVLFLALEMVSLSLYALVAQNRRDPTDTEAALKYFTLGGVSAGFFLFGLTYLYGSTGTLRLDEMSFVFQSGEVNENILLLGLLCAIAGLTFKLAAAPFHFWAPDVYERGPTLVTAWIASAVKIGATVVLVQILATSTVDNLNWLGPVLVTAAILSLLIGNFGALRQTEAKRLLAYSAIAHAGTLLVGAGLYFEQKPAILLYYGISYGLATLGAFLALSLLERRRGFSIKLSDWTGMWREAPITSLCFVIFVLSLAGIPPLAGFTSKFLLLLAAARNALDIELFIVALVILLSVLALYYYLKLLIPFLRVNDGQAVQAMARSADEEDRDHLDINPDDGVDTLPKAENEALAKSISPTEVAIVGLLAVVVLLAGLLAAPILDFFAVAG